MKKLNPKFIISVLCLMIPIILVCLYKYNGIFELMIDKPITSIFNIPYPAESIVDPIRDRRQVAQVFIGENNKITSIEVQIGTYMRKNHSDLIMVLSDKARNKELFKTDIDVDNLIDNGFAQIQIPNIPIKNDTEYIISFVASNTNDNDYVTIYRTEKNMNKTAGYAIVDGKSQDYNLSIKVWGKLYAIFDIPYSTEAIIGPIKDKRQVAQVFTAGYSAKITNIEVQIGTYMRKNNSNLIMILSDKATGKKIYQSTINVPNLADSSFCKIPIKNVPVERGKEYVISFNASNTNDNDYVTIYRTLNNKNKNAGYAMIDGKKQNYNLNIKVIGE